MRIVNSNHREDEIDCEGGLNVRLYEEGESYLLRLNKLCVQRLTDKWFRFASENRTSCDGY